MDIERIGLELERLSRPPTTHGIPDGSGIVQFLVRCPGGGADDVLEKAKSILAVIASNSSGRWPDEADWPQLLPGWFVAACPPLPSQEEAERWLTWWQRLSPQAQSDAEINKNWPLESWLYWMQPDNRQWIWWDGEVGFDSSHLSITVEVDGWPFPWGALRWLFKASGACAVEMQDSSF